MNVTQRNSKFLGLLGNLHKAATGGYAAKLRAEEEVRFGPRKIAEDAEAPISTWEEYLAADATRKNEISYEWCRVGHRYVGNGSQREAAMALYLRTTTPQRLLAPAYQPDPEELIFRPGMTSLEIADYAHAVRMNERWLSQRGHLTNSDKNFDAARDNEGHR